MTVKREVEGGWMGGLCDREGVKREGTVTKRGFK